jgi:uncharacterized protein (TIGR02284 family)
MNHSTHVLNGLVSATRDGKRFYALAAIEVTDSELKALFTRLAKVKGEIVQGLSTEIRAGGEKPADSGTWSRDFTKLYAMVRATLSDKNFAYLAELEDSEDHLLKAFDKALHDEETTPHAHTVNSLVSKTVLLATGLAMGASVRGSVAIDAVAPVLQPVPLLSLPASQPMPGKNKAPVQRTRRFVWVT